MSSYKIFIITIERGKERLRTTLDKLMLEGFKKKDIEVFYGYDGKKLYKSDIKKVTTPLCFSLTCTRGIVGCSLSHISLWRKISNMSNVDVAVILEDDTFIRKSLFEDVLTPYSNLLESNKVGIIQLSGFGFRLKETVDVSETYKLNAYASHYTTGCYMIGRQMCEVLYRHFSKSKVSYHIDFSLSGFMTSNNYKIVLSEPKIALQTGWSNSNVGGNGSSMDYLREDYKYALTVPILSFYSLIVTPGIIIIICLTIITLIFIPTLYILPFILGYLLQDNFSLDKGIYD